MKKRILLIGYNFYPEPTGIGKYSGEQMLWLAKMGYDCTVITTYPYYPYWKVQEPFQKKRLLYNTEKEDFVSGGKFTIFRCPIYVPSKPSGLTRIMLDLSFFLSAFIKLLLIIPQKKFDIVIAVTPSFLIGLLGILYKQINDAKLIYHIHDMQIEAARDLRMIKSKKVINSLFKIEKYIFNNCDIITCVGEGMAQKTRLKTNKKISLFINATDLKQFYPIKDRNSLKRLYGFFPTDKVILYSGAIGEKQGIDNIIYAADHFRKVNELKFVICGSGPYKEKLQNLSAKLSLQNVFFFPLQPVETFNQFLNMADLHLIIQKANAGDLVMPSKLTTVLAIGGLALVTANQGSGMYSLVKQHNMGIIVEAENQQALNEGILKAMSDDLRKISLNARKYAELNLSIDIIMSSFENNFIT